MDALRAGVRCERSVHLSKNIAMAARVAALIDEVGVRIGRQ